MTFLPRNRKPLFIVVIVLILLAGLEISLRAFLVVGYNASFLTPTDMIFKKYPLLKKPYSNDSPSTNANTFKILLLGASVLHPDFGDIEERLRQKLQVNLPSVEIINLSQAAHTTRDSLIKYKFLESISFDLVILYHGINDVRANNCPEERFKSDYSHYIWYEKIKILDRHRNDLNITVIPYSLDHLVHSLKQHFYNDYYVPRNSPKMDWLEFGSHIKTRSTFDKNMSLISNMAINRGESLMMMTFAYYVPSNYSYALFQNEKLDYFKHTVHPVELWGKPKNVINGIDAHNTATRTLVHRNPNLMFLDMGKSIPKNGMYFNDICHLSPKGCELFATKLEKLILEKYHGQ